MKKAIISILLLLGLALMVYRAVEGLGAVTALSDYQPWGLVKAVNIFTGAALAAGSFVVAAMVYVFGLTRMRPLVRPALLIGFIGHTFVLIALLYDVGRPLDVWRIITNPQPHSALMWTAWCEVTYTTAMLLELLPDWLGGRGAPAGLVSKLKAPLVIVSAALAVVYQSTLGTLYLASPHRISPLWYDGSLPALFFLSAVAAGLGVLIINALIGGRPGDGRPDSDTVTNLSVAMGVVLTAYLCLRAGSIFYSGIFTCVSPGCDGRQMLWFIAEVTIGGALPAILLAAGVYRESDRGLVVASALVVFGVFMNRIGVTVIGWENPPGAAYFPSAMEFYASFFFVLCAVLLYVTAARKLAHTSESR